MTITVEQLRAAAAKAGMARFYLDSDPSKPRKDMVLIGADFIERLHKELEKNERQQQAE